MVIVWPQEGNPYIEDYNRLLNLNETAARISEACRRYEWRSEEKCFELKWTPSYMETPEAYP
jgi:hypothetical protein